jgi:hypothetical protein
MFTSRKALAGASTGQTHLPSERTDAGTTRSWLLGSVAIPEAVVSGCTGGNVGIVGKNMGSGGDQVRS